MDLIRWLQEGDVSIQYQTYRDLLDEEKPELKNRISTEGFGKKLLSFQQEDGHWGGGYYRKKWISTHYTLLELLRLDVPRNKQIDKAVDKIISELTRIVEGKKIWLIKDICMVGMMMNVFCRYEVKEEDIIPMVDYILSQQMNDGGYNCNFNKPGYHTKHSSLHSTTSVIEGFNSFLKNGYKYRKDEIMKQRKEAIEFILMHRLYKSDKTGEIIRKSFTMLSFPPRWMYDILRALEVFREADIAYDERMGDALELIMKKRRKDGTWPVQNKHAGLVHFDMEKTGGSSRMNTLRVLRVLKHFRPEIYESLIK